MSAPQRPLVLLHGWGLDARVWQPLLPHLATGCVPFVPRCLSLPGYPEGDCDSVAAAVDALAAQVPPGALLLGWSLGGQVAQLIAQALVDSKPGHLAGLVLVASTPRFVAAEGWAAGQPAGLLAGFAAAVAQAPGPALSRFVALMNQGDGRAREINRLLAPLARPPLAPAPVLLQGLDWLQQLDLRPLAPALDLPALVVHGEADPLMPPAAARWLAGQLPRASLQVMAGAAHAPFLHDPAAFAALLAEWAAGLEG